MGHPHLFDRMNNYPTQANRGLEWATLRLAKERLAKEAVS